MIYPLLKIWLRPVFGTTLQSSQKSYKTPVGFRTIGGGRSDHQSLNRHGPSNASGITNMFNESEEQIVEDVKMQNMKDYAAAVSGGKPSKGSMASTEVEVTAEDRGSPNGEHQHVQRVHETW